MVISACKPAEAPPAAQLGEEEEEEEGGGLARLTARPPSQCAHGLRRSGVDTEGQPMRPAGRAGSQMWGGGRLRLTHLRGGFKWQWTGVGFTV